MRSVTRFAGGWGGVAGAVGRVDGWRCPPPAAVPPEEVLCVHFSVDGRSHGMWFVEAGSPPDTVPAELWAHWRVTAGGVWVGDLLRGRRVMVDAVLCTDDGPGWRALLHERAGPSRAALLAPVRQRPLLATFARGVDLSIEQARLAHHLLTRAAADSAGSWADVISPGLPRTHDALCCR